MDHTLQAELERIGKAGIEQGIENIQPGETRALDLSAESIYIHVAGVGVNVLSVIVERPLPNDGNK